MRVLALDPYHGGSYRAFLEGLIAHSRHEWTVLSLPDRFPSWRLQGGAVTLARKALALEGDFDVVFASDMLNLPLWLALVRNRWGRLPTVLYMHRNPLTPPLEPSRERAWELAHIVYTSLLVADAVWFNSRYHHQELLSALPELLGRFPDFNHLGELGEIVRKSRVVYPGMPLRQHDRFPDTRHLNDVPVILWNQRWQYDKNPDAFWGLINRLFDAGLKFRLILAGQHFEYQPEGFELAWRRYGDRILHYGYVEDFAEYSRLLHRSDVILSTARHEFFGVAVWEAVYCGAHPVLPNRLTYPEILPHRLHRPLLHAPVLYETEEEAFQIVSGMLRGEERPLPRATLQEALRAFDWSERIREFDTLLEEVASQRAAVSYEGDMERL
nr:MAG: glycosyl transferase family 1 [Bacteroidota bacterium]